MFGSHAQRRFASHGLFSRAPRAALSLIIPSPHARRAALAFLAVIPLALSCAAPAELARRSEKALADGDPHAAWQWAERAMRADPKLPRARDAMTAAAARVVPDWEERVRGLAAGDTVAGARLSLAFGAVRAELGGWNLTAPLDSAYLDDESRIRNGAAGILYARGMTALGEQRPRDAWSEFKSASEMVPGFRDVDARIRRSFELGIVRVAILPFDDDTGSGWLAPELADHIRGQVMWAMPEKKYPFLRFLPRDATVAHVRELGRITRDDAIHIGREMGAQRVVWGHIHGLRSDTRTDRWHDHLYRKVADRDSSGRSRVRWDDVEFETVSRERTVQVAWDFEVIETDEERALGRREGVEHVTARTVWTDYDAPGNYDDYAFAPPNWKSGRESEWKSAESRWKERYGDWSVPKLLEARRGAHEHPRYRTQDRDRFSRGGRPVVMDDLPPPEDLALVGLREVASQVWDVLKALERGPSSK